MSGYVPGYMYITNIADWKQATGSAGAGELYETTVNGVTVLIPNGVTPNYPYVSAGSNGGVNPGTWYVLGDLNNYGLGRYTVNDSSTPTRDLVAQAYINYFNRFAGPVAMEYWTDAWLYRGQKDNPAYHGSVDEMIRQGGENSGETRFVTNTPYAIPYTYYAPQLGCTNSTATNYAGAAAPLHQRLFTTPVIIANDSSCTYITASLSASQTEILNGSSSDLTWNTSNSTSNSIDNGVGSVGLIHGTVTVRPTSTTTYTLTASNSSNSNATQTASATVTVRNLPTATITVTPNNVDTGDTVTLAWRTTYAQSLTITDDAGNNVAGASPAESGSVDIVTKNTTTTSQTITYTLNVTGYLGKTAKATATLKVAPALRPYINSGGVWNRVDNVYIKDAGVWKLCTAAYVKDAGVWKQFIKG
jgi:hypothetical protein